MSDKFVTEWQSGMPETPCGAGSKVDRTKIIRDWLPRMVEKYEIYDINDIGAGDLNWIGLVDWPHEVDYYPTDVRPRHSDVGWLDIVETIPRKADLCMCFYVLNHFRKRQDWYAALDNIQQSGSKYLMMTYILEDDIPFKMLEDTPLADTGRHVWAYGIWDLQNEE